MTEEFLHYLWQFKLYDRDIYTVCGQELQINRPGTSNSDSGPDFFNAMIKIGETTWVGNVEIHIKSSDWIAHNHHHDEAYDNVILHVVYENNKNIKRKNRSEIPVLELKNKFDAKLYERYSYFLTNRHWIPCQQLLPEVKDFTIKNWMDRVLIEKLEKKSEIIYRQLKYNNESWEETFYQFIARNFGFKVNGLAFELMAKSLPLKYLGKHRNSRFQIEALVFGQAGLLNKSFNDEYLLKLAKEYDFLRSKFDLSPIDTHLWRFMRLRPSNFPTIRLSQFSSLIAKSSNLFSVFLEYENLDRIRDVLKVETSEYWKNHYVFDKKSQERKKQIGKNAINLVIINTIIPFLFAYGRSKGIESKTNRALKFLNLIPCETNSIIYKWMELGINIETAYHSQALIEIKNNYCNYKRCLHCAIGNEIIRGH